MAAALPAVENGAVVVHSAGTLVGCAGRDDSCVDPGGGSTHLVGGAGGVGAQEGPVVQGLLLILVQLLVVLVVGDGAVGGVGGRRQDAAVRDVDDHGGGAALLVVNGGHQVVEGLFGGLLELDVDGQGHVAAHLGLVNIALGEGVPVVGGGNPFGPGGAPEVFLKGGLRAGQADDGVHGVVVFFVVVLLFLQLSAEMAPTWPSRMAA